MYSPELPDALTVIAAHPALAETIRRRWEPGARGAGELPADVHGAVELVAKELPALAASEAGRAALGGLLEGIGGDVVLSWCSASAWRPETEVAPLLGMAARVGALAARVPGVAGDRVVAGPLRDALACVPLMGDGAALRHAANAEARARTEILIWEAGASALSLSELGPWIWGAESTFDWMIGGPAHGALRGRVLAARCLEVSAGGLPAGTDDVLVGRTLQVLQPLLMHPEPLVWIHAARALGRLTGALEQLEGMLLDWVNGDFPVLRQRAITAFASLPARRLGFLAGQLVALVAAPNQDASVLAAVAAATPYLFFERRDLWNRLCKRILAGDGGAVAARALARGLAALWRRGDREAETPLRALRELARHSPAASFADVRRWIEVTAVTDVVDAAERDPLDVEMGLDNLTRVAARYDDEEADARAARFAGSLAATFQEARRLALAGGRPRQRAAAINALEGLARSLALRLWLPLLATRPGGERIDAPDMGETWKLVADTPAEILDLVRERRQREGADPLADLPLEVLAIQIGGYALDACGGDADLGAGRGPTAHDTCMWLRKIEGLADGSRELPPSLQTALSHLFWRLVDTTRGTTLGEVDDVRWLGPFAAWWALVIDRPAMLTSLANALPMMAPGALERCCAEAEALRAAVSSGAPDGAWGRDAATALAALHAEDTELALALVELAVALQAFAPASGKAPHLEESCLELVRAANRLQAALADPVKGLHAAPQEATPPAEGHSAENTQRVAALVCRAIRARELSMLDVWLVSLGPVGSAMVETAVRGAIRKTPPPPPVPKKTEPKLIAGYEAVKPLGEGGVGSVWLVRKPGANRFFVLKIPKNDALAAASETERKGILASFVEEAAALAGLYHPNVANIIDRGVEQDVPYLVLEYLIGADLKAYSDARNMTLFELRQVVLDSCAGLAALHNAGLVHRDIKPANLWLRLPLAGGERFDPHKHRDPGAVPPLATVVIDFGMVRAAKVAPDAAGRFVAGTAGYIAPEQVLDPVELDGRADVYALAGTIYAVTTGRALFDEIENPRDRILAHMRRDPFEDAERLQPFPAAVAKLLREATSHKAGDRPWPAEFGRAFAGAL